MQYIENTLGIKVHFQAWKHTGELPFYLLDRYEFQQASLDSVKALFLYPKTELDQLASVKKQIAKIQKYDSLPVVIVLNNISRSRMHYLLSAHIPFIVPGKQIYLPFMGIVLQNRFYTTATQIDQLQPSTQTLFFYYLYQKKHKLYMNEAVRELPFSSMTATRAFRQLEQTDLFTIEKDGVQKILTGKYTACELYAKMQPYLTSPVRKTIYIDKQIELPPMNRSGMSALSEITMINPPDVPCYAIHEKKGGWDSTNILIDADAQVQVELWKYDPDIFSKNNAVDPLSLAAALNGIQDERVEEAVDILLNKIWEVL